MLVRYDERKNSYRKECTVKEVKVARISKEAFCIIPQKGTER